MHSTPGLKNTLPAYKYISWMYPFARKFFPKYVSTLAELGQAMIYVATKGYEKYVLEIKDFAPLTKGN